MNTVFSKATLDFLIENRLRNEKAWFEEHKDQYRTYVIEPLMSLVEGLSPVLLSIDDRLTCCSPSRKLRKIFIQTAKKAQKQSHSNSFKRFEQLCSYFMSIEGFEI